MAFKYRVGNDGIYYITITVVEWIGVLPVKSLQQLLLKV